MEKPSKIVDFKSALSDLRKRYPKIAGASVESIDEVVAKDLSDAQFSPTGEGHDPVALAEVSAAARDALNKAFARRSDLLDLNTRSIQRALQFKRFSDSSQANLDADLAGIATAQAQALADANHEAVGLYNAQNSNEAKAMAKQAEGASVASADKVGKERARETALKSIHSANSEYERVLQLAHERPNGPLNYPERLQLLKGIYINELKNAAEAVHAYRSGLEIFGATLKTGDAKPGEPGFIYALYDGFYECERVKMADHAARVEVTKIITVSFFATFSDARPDTTFIELGGNHDVDWGKSGPYIRARKLAFKLSPDYFGGLKDVRVLAIGLRCMYQTPQTLTEDQAALTKLQRLRVDASPAMFGCTVTPPRRKNDIARPPIRLGQISLVDGGSAFDPVYKSGPNVESIALDGNSPAASWMIELDEKLQFPSRLRNIEALILPTAADPPGFAQQLVNWNGYQFKGFNIFFRVSGKLS